MNQSNLRLPDSQAKKAIGKKRKNVRDRAEANLAVANPAAVSKAGNNKPISD
jgi:hypothetical protein